VIVRTLARKEVNTPATSKEVARAARSRKLACIREKSQVSYSQQTKTRMVRRPTTEGASMAIVATASVPLALPPLSYAKKARIGGTAASKAAVRRSGLPYGTRV
jgi:hypothetical protein